MSGRKGAAGAGKLPDRPPAGLSGAAPHSAGLPGQTAPPVGPAAARSAEAPAETAGLPAAWVYMLRCENGSLYTGWTNDLARRISAHKAGRGAKYTRAFKAASLAWAERQPDKPSALRREAEVKKLPKAKKEAMAAEWAEGLRKIHLEPAAKGDEEALRLLCGWYAKNSTAIFRYSAPTPAEWRKSLCQARRQAPVLIARSGSGELLGYACAHALHPYEAFAWDVELSIYLVPWAKGVGAGAMLYHALLGLLRRRGYWNAYAILADPNPASERFHRKMGFALESRRPRCGYKLGQWLGTSAWVLPLCEGTAPPRPLKAPLSATETRRLLRAAEAGTPWQEL